MSYAVEECTEFMRERPSRDPLVYLQCIVLEHVFIRIPLRVYIYILHIKTSVFVNLEMKMKN